MSKYLNTGCTMPKLKAKAFPRSKVPHAPLLLTLNHGRYVALAALAQRNGQTTVEYATKILGRAIDKKLINALKS